MSAAPDAGREPTADQHAEPPTVVGPVIGVPADTAPEAGVGEHETALVDREPDPAVSAETLLPGDGPADPEGEDAAATAGAQADFVDPAPYAAAGSGPDSEGGDPAPGASLLDRRPEVGVAAGFAGGFLLATILRRLGR